MAPRHHQAAYILGNYFFRWSMLITLTGSALLALAGMWIGFAKERDAQAR